MHKLQLGTILLLCISSWAHPSTGAQPASCRCQTCPKQQASCGPTVFIHLSFTADLVLCATADERGACRSFLPIISNSISGTVVPDWHRYAGRAGSLVPEASHHHGSCWLAYQERVLAQTMSTWYPTQQFNPENTWFCYMHRFT